MEYYFIYVLGVLAHKNYFSALRLQWGHFLTENARFEPLTARIDPAV